MFKNYDNFTNIFSNNNNNNNNNNNLNLHVLTTLMTSIHAAMFMLAVTAPSTEDRFVQLDPECPKHVGRSIDF